MDKEKFKSHIIKVVAEVTQIKCCVCKKLISKHEQEIGNGACMKCWEK